MSGLPSSRIYDVFLSSRRKDSASFTSHLHTYLLNAGIYVFRYEKEGNMVEQLQTITQSRIYIIVLSENYPDSIWCLQELESIMRIRRTRGQVVVPVFYELDPSEVCNLGIKTSGTRDQTRNWETALREIGGIAGFVVTNSRNENEDIEKVVDHVLNLINDTNLFIDDHLLGAKSRVKDVIQRLNIQQSKDPQLLGIWGMGGIGKTTIAKAVYNKIHHYFEAKSILLNVREVWKQENDKVSLQQRLLSFISKTAKIKIDTVELGKSVLQQRLCQKRILLVLDDVNELDQLNALCGSSEWFGQGSRIIITTRNKQILSQLKVDHVYTMKEMDYNESLELFSWHAFKQPSPSKHFADLSRDAIKYCGGLPLALQVIGSFLGMRRETVWKSALETLEVIPNDIVMNNMRISFDGLANNEKGIFLDIASFLIGMDLYDVIHILNYSGHVTKSGINVLVDQSLVTIDSKNRIGMHNLVRGMGREIIRQKSVGVAKERTYDVFLSFRGEDSRAKFISHLYTSLQNAGIYVFKDDNEIQRGDQISISLLQAIRHSRVSIVVLSRNYANSRWCMLELENIMELHRTKGLVVVPVFYEVDPSEVRNQTGKFGEAFKDLISSISVDEYRKRNWNTTLLEVGGIAGVVIINSRDL